MSAKVIILNSLSGYSPKHDSMLRKYVESGTSLFCALGKDCDAWEEAVDWLCVRMNESGDLKDAFVTTTSHPGESLEEVREFAEHWIIEGVPSVEVVEI